MYISHTCKNILMLQEFIIQIFDIITRGHSVLFFNATFSPHGRFVTTNYLNKCSPQEGE